MGDGQRSKQAATQHIVVPVGGACCALQNRWHKLRAGLRAWCVVCCWVGASAHLLQLGGGGTADLLRQQLHYLQRNRVVQT